MRARLVTGYAGIANEVAMTVKFAEPYTIYSVLGVDNFRMNEISSANKHVVTVIP